MKLRRLICLLLIIAFSAGGLYVSLHLAELHYKKPRFQLNLINTLPFMERWFPRDEVEAAAELEEAARKKNKRDWWNTFISWFDLDAEMDDQFHVY